MKKLIILLLFILAFNVFCFSQSISINGFLGTWMQMDNNNYIEIVKDQNKYLIIEYRSIKHELFFGGDGDSAVFVAFGKGPPGFEIVMLKMNGDKMERFYFTEENYDWELSPYSYYRKL